MFRCRVLLFMIVACAVSSAQIINPGGGSSGATSVGLSLNTGATCGAAAVTGSPVTTTGTLNINLTGANGDIVTFNGSNCPVDSATLLSAMAPLASPTFTGIVTVPAGAAGAAGFVWAGDTAGAGLYRPSASVYAFTGGTNEFWRITPTSFRMDNAAAFGFTSSSNSSVGAADTAISRSAADVMACGNGTVGDTSCQFKAAAYMSVGTKFTSNAGCTESTTVGGATAGKFTVGQGTACTIIITMGNTATAPNGWTCTAYDQTAVPAIAIRQTASTTTTCSLLMTVATNDVITFSAVGY